MFVHFDFIPFYSHVLGLEQNSLNDLYSRLRYATRPVIIIVVRCIASVAYSICVCERDCCHFPFRMKFNHLIETIYIVYSVN